jgi:hypothetical protein
MHGTRRVDGRPKGLQARDGLQTKMEPDHVQRGYAYVHVR